MLKKLPQSKINISPFPSREPMFYISKLGGSLIKSLFWLILLAVFFAFAPRTINDISKTNTFKKYINIQYEPFKNQSYETDIFLAISSGLFASVVLTGTLSIAETNQRKKDFEDILSQFQEKAEKFILETKELSTDAVIQELVGDKILFDEINNLVIRKDFIRTKYFIKLDLKWHDQNKEYLLKEANMSSTIKNFSNKEVEYKILVIEELELEDEFPGSTKILSVEYTINGESIKLQDDSLKIDKENTEFPLIKFSENVKIPPKSSLLYKVKTESVIEAKQAYPIISLVNTSELEIEIIDHPEDLSIKSRLLHPDHKKLKLLTDARCHKRWKVTGILPGQGVQIRWKPHNTSIPYTPENQVANEQ